MNDTLEFSLLDNATLDPRPRWKTIASNIADVRLTHVSDEARVRILALRLKTLDAALASALQSNDYAAADAALGVFDRGLANDVGAEYERMREAASDGIDRLVDALNSHCWNGLEVEGVRSLLQKSERVARVDWFHVETSTGRRIDREAIREATRPSTFTTNGGDWVNSKSFTPLATIRRLADDAAELERRSKIPPWHDSRDRNVSRGVA